MNMMVSQITSLMIVYSTVYSGADQRKHQNSASLAFVRGIHRWPVNSPHKGPVKGKMIPFDDVIMDSFYGNDNFICIHCFCFFQVSFMKTIESWWVSASSVYPSLPESKIIMIDKACAEKIGQFCKFVFSFVGYYHVVLSVWSVYSQFLTIQIQICPMGTSGNLQICNISVIYWA